VCQLTDFLLHQSIFFTFNSIIEYDGMLQFGSVFFRIYHLLFKELYKEVQNLKFSQQCWWRFISSGISCCVDW